MQTDQDSMPLPALKTHSGRLGAQAPKLLFAATALVLAYLTLVPLGLLVYSSFIDEAGRLPMEPHALSFRNYVQVLTDPGTYLLLSNTVLFTAGATLLGLGLAISLAWLIERTDIRGRRLLFVGILVPMAIPNMIYAQSWVLLLNPSNGLINETLAGAGLGWLSFNIYSLGGMILVQGLALASHAFLLVAASFKMLDPTLEEQSAISGKGIAATLWRVTLPALKPALLAAIVFFTVVNMETFDVPATLGMPAQVHVFSTMIYEATRPASGGLPDYGMASTLSVLLLIVAACLIWVYQRQTRNAKQFVTVTGKAFRPRRIALGRYRLPVTALAFAVLVFIVVLPTAMLVWRSLIAYYAPPSVQAFGQASLKAYFDLFASHGLSSVLSNTALMAIVAGVATTMLASLIGWMVLRAPVGAGWRSALNRLAFLSMAVPSIVLGLSVTFVYLTLPLGIYGTIWIMAIAMVTKYIAFTSGMMIAAQVQISPELEEASRIAGAG